MSGLSNAMNYMVFPGVLKDITKEEIVMLRKFPRHKVCVFIMTQVSQLSTLSLSAIRSKGRRRPIVRARQLIMYYMDVYADIAQPEIGQIVALEGHFDHTTVIHARDTIRDILDSRCIDRDTVTVQKIHLEFIAHLKNFILNESNSTDGQSR